MDFLRLTHLCKIHSDPGREHSQMSSLNPHQSLPTPVITNSIDSCGPFLYLMQNHIACSFLQGFGEAIVIYLQFLILLLKPYVCRCSLVEACPLLCLALFALYYVYTIQLYCCMQLQIICSHCRVVSHCIHVSMFSLGSFRIDPEQEYESKQFS